MAKKSQEYWKNEPEVKPKSKFCLNCQGSGLIKKSRQDEVCEVCKGTGK